MTGGARTHRSDAIRRSFDATAEWYARDFADELVDKPFDQALLNRFSAIVGRDATVLDVGCGPGHVGAHLATEGVSVIGLDLSEGMVDVARSLHPGLEFVVGDLRDLPQASHVVDGVVAFYSIIYFDNEETELALSEIRRVLKPGGHFLAAIHVGSGTEVFTEYRGHEVDIEIVMRPLIAFAAAASRSGFELLFAETRAPYPKEHQTSRGYTILRAAQTPESESTGGPLLGVSRHGRETI